MKKAVLFLLTPIFLSSCFFWGQTTEPQYWFTPFSINGDYYNFDCTGEYAYLAAGPNGLRIFDISDPANCIEVDTFMDIGLTETVLQIEIDNDIAYMATNERILILDLSVPLIPVLIGEFTAFGRKMIAEASFIYQIEWQQPQTTLNTESNIDFAIYDVSNPDSIVEIYRITDTDISDFVLYGEYIYYLEESGRFSVLNVSDRSSPLEVNIPIYEFDAASINASSNAVFINAGEMFCFNITVPESPLADYRFDTGGINSCGAFSVLGNYIYILHTDSIAIADISAPASGIPVEKYLVSFQYLGLAAPDFLNIKSHEDKIIILSESGLLIIGREGE